MFAWILLLVVLATPAWAQDKAGQKEWNETLAAAKKEGRVVVAGSPDPVMRGEIIPRFTSRFGINVEFLAGRSSEIAAKVRTERSAGVYSTDVFLAGPDTTVVILHGEKIIDPLKPLLILPEVVERGKWKRGDLWFVDPEGNSVLRAFNSVNGIVFINTEYVKLEEIRSAKDLLNPKWRGKISTEDPRAIGSGVNLAGRFYDHFGEEFVKKLYVDQKPVISRERRQFTDWLARGTQPICLNCRDDDVKPLLKEGFKLSEVFELTDMPGMLTSSPWLLTYANKAPHPQAAQVFINWLLSKEALETYSRSYGSATLRTDVDESFLNPLAIPRPGVKYFDDGEWNWVLKGRKEISEKVWKLLKAN